MPAAGLPVPDCQGSLIQLVFISLSSPFHPRGNCLFRRLPASKSQHLIYCCIQQPRQRGQQQNVRISQIVFPFGNCLFGQAQPVASLTCVYPFSMRSCRILIPNVCVMSTTSIPFSCAPPIGLRPLHFRAQKSSGTCACTPLHRPENGRKNSRGMREHATSAKKRFDAAFSGRPV